MRTKIKQKTVEEQREYRRKHWLKINTPPEGCNPCPKGCLECPFPTCEYNGTPRPEESKILRDVLNKNALNCDNKTFRIAASYSKIQWR